MIFSFKYLQINELEKWIDFFQEKKTNNHITFCYLEIYICIGIFMQQYII